MSDQAKSPSEEIICPDEAATYACAARLADRLRQGDVCLLHGDLGAGKTTFAREMIRQLAKSPGLIVPSPTFTLVQTYDTLQGPVWHFDLYRLKDADEIFDLGWDDALGQAILLIEWPDRLGAYTPSNCLHITLTPLPDNSSGRLITITRISQP